MRDAIDRFSSPREYLASLRVPRAVAATYLRRWIVWKLFNGLLLEAPLCVLDVVLLVRGFSVVRPTGSERTQLTVISIGAAVRTLGVLVHGISVGVLLRRFQELTESHSAIDVLRDLFVLAPAPHS
jgi:hypothetical protein